MCPDLTEKRPKLGFVTTYFSAVRAIGSWLKPLSPAAASWADAELASCARYAAVTLGQRLDRNQVCAAALRSY